MSVNDPTDGGGAEYGAQGGPAGGGTDERTKRAGKAVLGGALVALGLRRRSLVGSAMAAAGGWLLYQTFRGGSDGGQSDSVATERTTGPTTVEQSITVGQPPEEVAEYWRDPERLSEVVGHFAEVESAGEDRQRWTVRGPGDWTTSWEVRLIEEESDRLFRWEAAGESVPLTGSVHFREAPAGRGTEVALSLTFDPPGGAVGEALVERLGIVPKTAATKALHRFKSLVETGEVPTLERNPSGRGRGDLL